MSEKMAKDILIFVEFLVIIWLIYDINKRSIDIFNRMYDHLRVTTNIILRLADDVDELNEAAEDKNESKQRDKEG